MKWERIKTYLLPAAAAVILAQAVVIVDYHLRVSMIHENTTAWFDTSTQFQIRAEEWEVTARRLASINHSCAEKLHGYREFVSQIFDPRKQSETPLKPLDLIEAPKP